MAPCTAIGQMAKRRERVVFSLKEIDARRPSVPSCFLRVSRRAKKPPTSTTSATKPPIDHLRNTDHLGSVARSATQIIAIMSPPMAPSSAPRVCVR